MISVIWPRNYSFSQHFNSKKYSRHILGPETVPNRTLLFVESFLIFRWHPFSVGFQLNKSRVHHSHSISRWHAFWQSFSVIASGSGFSLISFPEYAVLISTHPVWDKILLQIYVLLNKQIILAYNAYAKLILLIPASILPAARWISNSSCSTCSKTKKSQLVNI